jgi:outer membrane receptor protein involved in Fe transport
MIAALAALVVSDPSAASRSVEASEIVIVRGERLRATPEPVAQTSLSGTTLQSQAGVRLDEALRIVPGIGLFRRTSSGAANATIQGLSLRPIAPNGAGRAFVSLDGVPQNDPFGGWIFWGRYDPAFLERVDVKRGASGAGFGPMALTGTLDLVEARGQSRLVQASIGSLNSRHGAARGSVRTQGAVFTAMGAFDRTDGAFGVSPSQRGLVDQPINSEAMSLTLVTDIARDNGAWSFRASGFTESKSAGLIGGQSSAEGFDVSVARRVEGDWGQARFLLYGQGRDFSNQGVAVAAGRTSATPSLDQYATPASALGGSIVVAPLSASNLPILTVDWRRAQGQTQELFRYIGQGFTRARIAGGQQDLVGLGAALPRALPVGASGIVLDGAVRLDYWANSDARRVETDRTTGALTLNESPANKDGFLASGRVSLSVFEGQARLSAYRTFRPPTLNELHRPFRVGNDVTEANGALVPETLTGLDLDFKRSVSVSGGTMQGFATLYANRLYDPIANVTVAIGPGILPRVGFLPAGGSLRERRNVGRVDAVGVEAMFSWAGQASQPSWQLGLSMTDARVEGGVALPQLTGKRPAQAPIWSASASLTWPIASVGQLSATLRGEGARFEDDLNTRKLAAYGVADVRLERQLNPNTTMFVSVENVLDQKVSTALSGDGIVSLTQGRVVRIGFQLRQ